MAKRILSLLLSMLMLLSILPVSANASGTDAIKIKPESTVEVEIPLKNAENLKPKILLWDSLSRLRPVGSK